jgi:hypothetical protein
MNRKQIGLAFALGVVGMVSMVIFNSRENGAAKTRVSSFAISPRP